jgi:pimeloyl-ACP methyl ester carboxylesterase
MNDFARVGADLMNLGWKITEVYTRKILNAQKDFVSHAHKAATEALTALPPSGRANDYMAWPSYLTDCAQRWILFWDTLRQRGNDFIKHERSGKPPVLTFEHEMLVDGRKLPRPVNYALLRIIPPDGTKIDDRKRPYVIVDPRAGHGPGIGGFKKDSEIGVALKAGHPVYFVSFFPRPEPGQTLLEVCAAQAQFVKVVAQRHPDSPRPVIMGNCQGGWATMLLAAANPDLVGPLVVNGAPLSYWSGNWSGGEAENPMRYLGGLMGGAWAALLASDLGNGLVDGANFVANFERLNPANTLWTKYYHLFANVDTEPPRFLEFERWWGGFFHMNEAEIRWILDNLFVGNRLARGEARGAANTFIDLKAIRSPIVVFSSGGDNITPPQQALNWIADVYQSTEEIKANGQVIVGLAHPDVGHLGIFVSGKVAKKEHAQIVEVLEYIEALRPGLYLMEIHEGKGPKPQYEVTFEERRLEDLRRINKWLRHDEKPFEVVAAVSALTERAYALAVRPFLRPFINETVAEWMRLLYPLRVQRWAVCDCNPLMWPVRALAPTVKVYRKAAAPDNPFRRAEKAVSDALIAGLDCYRDVRDASMEGLFFKIFGTLTVAGVGEEAGVAPQPVIDPRELPLVREALAAIGKGGYPEAVALVGALIGRGAGRIPLTRLALVDRFVRSEALLSSLPPDEVRRIKAEQAVIAELEPEQGLQSLAKLLADPGDRERALALIDEAVVAVELTSEQRHVLERIRHVLGGEPSAPRARGPRVNCSL